jgi:hypothetical protein
MARLNDDDVVEEKVAKLEIVVESQEAMGEIAHSQRVLIAGESLVVFAFGTIAEADQDLGLTDVNDFLNKAHRFPFLAEPMPSIFLFVRPEGLDVQCLMFNVQRRIPMNVLPPLLSKVFLLNLNRSTIVEHELVLQCHQLENEEDSNTIRDPTRLQVEINVRDYCAYNYEHAHIPASRGDLFQTASKIHQLDVVTRNGDLLVSHVR